MKVGDLVRRNISNAIGIVTEVRSYQGWDHRKTFRVLFPNNGLMWLTSQVLEAL